MNAQQVADLVGNLELAAFQTKRTKSKLGLMDCCFECELHFIRAKLYAATEEDTLAELAALEALGTLDGDRNDGGWTAEPIIWEVLLFLSQLCKRMGKPMQAADFEHRAWLVGENIFRPEHAACSKSMSFLPLLWQGDFAERTHQETTAAAG